MTSEWSQTCNPSLERLLPELPRSRRMAPGWTLLQMASGGADICVHSWMSAFLIPTPSPTVALPSRPVIVCMNIKKRACEQRILEVEHASFTPLVFSASGGLAKEATYFYKRLASRLAEKRDQPYTCTMNWLRCLLSFSLLRSAIRCFRGARSSKGSWVIGPPIPSDLINSEALLTNPS